MFHLFLIKKQNTIWRGSFCFLLFLCFPFTCFLFYFLWHSQPRRWLTIRSCQHHGTWFYQQVRPVEQVKGEDFTGKMPSGCKGEALRGLSAMLTHLAHVRGPGVGIRTLITWPEIAFIQAAARTTRFRAGPTSLYLSTLTLATQTLGARSLAACSLAIGRAHILQASFQGSNKVLKVISSYTVRKCSTRQVKYKLSCHRHYKKTIRNMHEETPSMYEMQSVSRHTGQVKLEHSYAQKV